jgi:hypothetical protein
VSKKVSQKKINWKSHPFVLIGVPILVALIALAGVLIGNSIKKGNGSAINNNVTGDGNIVVGNVEGDFNVYQQAGITEQTTELTTEEEEEPLVGHPNEFSESQTISDEYMLELIAEAERTQLPDSEIISGTVTYKATGTQFTYYYARPRFDKKQIPVTIARDTINNKFGDYNRFYADYSDQDYVFYFSGRNQSYSSLYTDQEYCNEMKALLEYRGNSFFDVDDSAYEFSSYSVVFLGNYVNIDIYGERSMWGGTGEAFSPYTMLFDCRTGKQLEVSDVIDINKGVIEIIAALDDLDLHGDFPGFDVFGEEYSVFDMFRNVRIVKEGVYLRIWDWLFTHFGDEIFISKSSLKQAGALKIDW